jgi:hypothetical protein
MMPMWTLWWTFTPLPSTEFYSSSDKQQGPQLRALLFSLIYLGD